MKRLLLILPVLCSVCLYSQNTILEDSPMESEKMEWFADAKLGIFIHWGIYAVDGISESWAFFNNYISQENYLKQLDGFGAENYNPGEWIKLIKDSGAKYAVITSKHHDGVSLWNTQASFAISTKNGSTAARDLLTPFISELKKSGLKTGIYFSLPDWNHPYYDIKTRTQKRYNFNDEPDRWQKFIDYYQFQLNELSQQYKPDLLWFDGDWEHSPKDWETENTKKILRKFNPEIIINSRLDGKGDYATPEQGIPVVRPPHKYWELCYTINDSWGYQPLDQHYKSANMIVRTLIDCIAMGGNLLLDIAPMADGSLPHKQILILKELGRWTNKFQEAVYATRHGLDWWDCVDKNSFSKDHKTLFVYLDSKKDLVEITGLTQKPKGIRWLGSSSRPHFDYSDNKLSVDLQNLDFDSIASVLAIDFWTPVVIQSPAVENSFELNEILGWKDSKKAIREITKMTAHGEKLFSGKMKDDGSDMDPGLKFESEIVKNWVRKHAEVLYKPEAGIDGNHYYGKSALSADHQTLYLFVEGQPTGPIAIKGLKNEISRVRIVGEGSMIGYEIYNKLYWSEVPGIVYIDIPANRLDPNMTVIAVLLDSPINLFSEEIKPIESNN